MEMTTTTKERDQIIDSTWVVDEEVVDWLRWEVGTDSWWGGLDKFNET